MYNIWVNRFQVVMNVLKHLSFIEDKYLRVLVRDKELYQVRDLQIEFKIVLIKVGLLIKKFAKYLTEPTVL